MKFCVLMFVTISSFVRFETEAMFEGVPANYTEYPFMVQLLTVKRDDACSGCLISWNHILSTIQCYLSTPASYAVAGEIHGLAILRDQRMHQHAQTRLIVEYIPHPKALELSDKKEFSVEWDMSVLKVNEPFEENNYKYVAPVNIASSLPSQNEELLLLSYGCNSTNTSTKGELRSALITVDLHHPLKDIHPTSLLGKFKKSGAKPCSGDAGGSLYSKTSGNLYGTLSGRVAESPIYIAFANAANKESFNWIMKTIDKPWNKYNETVTTETTETTAITETTGTTETLDDTIDVVDKENISNTTNRRSPTKRLKLPQLKDRNYRMQRCLAFRQHSYDKPRDFISIGIFAIILSSIIAF